MLTGSWKSANSPASADEKKWYRHAPGHDAWCTKAAPHKVVLPWETGISG
ncbi:MAG: hypothetical protein ACK2TU_12740 [Anaerolineales bacterium]